MMMNVGSSPSSHLTDHCLKLRVYVRPTRTPLYQALVGTRLFRDPADVLFLFLSGGGQLRHLQTSHLCGDCKNTEAKYRGEKFTQHRLGKSF